jgi:hypothetical protein
MSRINPNARKGIVFFMETSRSIQFSYALGRVAFHRCIFCPTSSRVVAL